MLVSGFIKGLKVVFDTIINIIAFLLVKAGLWLCALFTFAYILVCAVSGVKLEGGALFLMVVGAIITAVIGVLLAVKRYVALKQAVPEKRKMRYLEKTNLKEEYKAKKQFESDAEWDNGSKRQRSVADEDRFAASQTSKRYTEPQFFAEPAREQKNDYPQNGRQQSNNYYGRPLYERKDVYPSENYSPQNGGGAKYSDFNDLKKQYFGSAEEEAAAARDRRIDNPYLNQGPVFEGYQKPPKYTNPYENSGTGFESYQKPMNVQNPYQDQNRFEPYNSRKNEQNFSQAQFYEPQSQQKTNQYQDERKANPFDSFFDRYNNSESPMVFSTRKDPDILIYEYSDRLEFYKKNEIGGLTLLSVERKS